MSSNPTHFNFLTFSLKLNTSKAIFNQVSKDLKGFHLIFPRLTRGMRFFLVFSSFRNSRVLILILNFLAFLTFSWLDCELGSCYKLDVHAFCAFSLWNCTHSNLGVFALNPKTLEISCFPQAIDAWMEAQILLWWSRNKARITPCLNLIKIVWAKP